MFHRLSIDPCGISHKTTIKPPFASGFPMVFHSWWGYGGSMTDLPLSDSKARSRRDRRRQRRHPSVGLVGSNGDSMVISMVILMGSHGDLMLLIWIKVFYEMQWHIHRIWTEFWSVYYGPNMKWEFYRHIITPRARGVSRKIQVWIGWATNWNHLLVIVHIIIILQIR